MYEVTRWPGRTPVDQVDAMYSRTVKEADLAKTEPMPEWWMAPYLGIVEHYHPNAGPWQEAECVRLWEEFGPAKFAGLDLFGVV